MFELIFPTILLAQGLTRSTGIGIQLGFWNITDHPTYVRTSRNGTSAAANIGGIGAWLSFFSRVYNNWFLEFKFGAFGSVRAEIIDTITGEADVNAVAILPILLGLRSDILSTRLPSAIQPYFTCGSGRYWTTTVVNDVNEDIIESNVMYGLYTGGGINIILTSWFALNFDLKYHFVDFKFEKDYSGLEFDM